LEKGKVHDLNHRLYGKKTEDSDIIEIHVAAHVRKIKLEHAKAG
jgi:hypothetical protein